LTTALFIFQIVAGAVVASPAAPAVSLALSPLEPSAPAASPSEPVSSESPASEPIAVEAPGVHSALRLMSARVQNPYTPRMSFTWADLDASAAAYASSPSPLNVPLLDDDQNMYQRARSMNGASQFLSESINGATIGSPPARTDIDWFRFTLNYTVTAADRIEFDVAKDTNDEVEVVVYTFPATDPDGGSHIAFYDFMNKSQNMTENSRITVTAYETTTYIMLLITPRRNACCVVNYEITNITFTSTSMPPDDNNNVSRAESYNPTSKPTNREVEQNWDMFDVFDLTGQISPEFDRARGDQARFNLSAQIGYPGREGFSDYNDSTGVNTANTISIGILWIVYQDVLGVWHGLNTPGVPGQPISIVNVINGTPVYAAFSAGAAIVNASASGFPLSSIPGWLRYNITGFAVSEDLAPRMIGAIPPGSMDEDDPASGADIYDLASYFGDDHDNGFLRFSVPYNQQSAFVRTNVTGSSLSITVLQANWWGNVTLQVAAIDRGIDQVAQTPDDHVSPSNFFVVHVVPINDPPNITSFGGQTNTGGVLLFNLDQGASATLVTVVSDADGTDGQSFSVVPTLPFGNMDSVTGVLSLRPQNIDVGTYNVSVIVRDYGGATATASVRIVVRNINDEPRFATVGGFSLTALPSTFNATQGQLFVLRVFVSDPDYLAGIKDNLQYAADKTFVTLTRDPNDFRNLDLSFTPTNAQVGFFTVRLSVTDGGLGQFDDNVTIPITVHNVNDAPVLVSVATTSLILTVGPTKQVEFNNYDRDNQRDGAKQGQAFTMTVRADDPDVAQTLGDTLTFSTDLSGKFTVSYGLDGLSAEISFVPNQADALAGTVEVNITVNDTGSPAGSDTIQVRIQVANVNDPPVLTPVSVLNLTEDQQFAYQFVAVDPDGDPLIYASDSIFFPVESATGLVEFTPTNDLIGGQDLQFDVLITARDNHTGVASFKVHVKISNVNDPPSALRVLNPVDGSAYASGEVVAFSGDGDDVDKGDRAGLTFRWFADDVLLGDGKSISHAIDNPAATPKLVTVRLQVSDAHGASSNSTVTITVNAVPPKSPGFEAAMVVGGLVAALAVASVARRAKRL
jgi:hypothetical protein